MNTHSNSYREARSKMEIEAIKEMNTMIEKQQEEMITQKYEKAIAWIDIETTGTNPQTDKILQIALIITDNKFNTIEQYEWIVKHNTQEVYEQANEYVQNMHNETNLWNRIKQEGQELNTIDNQLSQTLTKIYNSNNGYKINIGGNSVHFDNSFIQQQMPLSAKHISHRVLDISAVLQYFRVVGNKVPLPKHTVSHDALDDIQWTITQAKAIQEHIKELKQ